VAGKIRSDYSSTKLMTARKNVKTPTCQSASKPSCIVTWTSTKYQFLTVSAHVCLVDRAPVLTVVGELHSLTDWQVSDASEDAELDDFCKRDKNRQAISRTVKKYMINTL